MKAMLISCLLAIVGCAAQDNWEKDNPTCATACDFVTTCGATTQDQWVCDEGQCTDAYLLSIPYDGREMLPVSCSDWLDAAALETDRASVCESFTQCMRDNM